MAREIECGDRDGMGAVREARVREARRGRRQVHPERSVEGHLEVIDAGSRVRRGPCRGDLAHREVRARRGRRHLDNWRCRVNEDVDRCRTLVPGRVHRGDPEGPGAVRQACDVIAPRCGRQVRDHGSIDAHEEVVQPQADVGRRPRHGRRIGPEQRPGRRRADCDLRFGHVGSEGEVPVRSQGQRTAGIVGPLVLPTRRGVKDPGRFVAAAEEPHRVSGLHSEEGERNSELVHAVERIVEVASAETASRGQARVIRHRLVDR